MIQAMYLPTKILFGPRSVSQVGQEARALGHHAMVVSYPDIRKLGFLDTVLRELNNQGLQTEVYEDLEPNPRSSTIDKAAEIARQQKVDLVIGLGGGSAMDAAKGIAMASSGKAPIWEYMMGRAQVSGPVPALIQIPTLAGTGSELNPIAVITDWDSHEKRYVINPNLWAKVAIIDPELTVTLSKKLTAAGGVDMLAHIMECYLVSDKTLPMNDAIREAVMKVTVEFVPKVLARPDDIDARSQLSWGATIASSDLSRLGGSAGSMTCHGIEHAVSGYYDINHGAGLAALLPVWMKQIFPVRKERMELLGKNVFGKNDGIAAFEDWLYEIGMKLRLRDLDCELERADEIANIALKVWDYQLHPTKIDANTIARIYRDAY